MAEQKGKDIPRTEISDLGEFGLIHRITKNFELRNKSSVKGIGDDCAVIASGKANAILISTDLLIEGIDFDLAYHPLRHLGYKAIVASISDIYAMNARPSQITVSIAVSNRFSAEAIDELYEGIWHGCDFYDVDLVGGDTSASEKGLLISVTCIGESPLKQIVYRSGAKVGDQVMVTGDLGAAYLGLQLLEREKQIFLENPEIQPDLEEETYILRRQLKPEARKELIDIFEELKIKPNAMIDVSDGLSSDMLQICTASGLGCRLQESGIPIAKDTFERAIKFQIPPLTAALSGGEDYEILFTVNAEDAIKLSANPLFSLIGEMTPQKEGYKLISNSGQVHNLVAQGWNHLNLS